MFLYVSDSRIFGREVSESRIFVFLANGFDQNHDKIVFKSKISRHGVTFWNSRLIDVIFIYLRISCTSCLAADSF